MTDEPVQANDSQLLLVEALEEVRAALEGRADERGSAPPPLELIAKTFQLSRFERALLLLCAGVELDSSLAELCANAQGDPARAYPTFSLALAKLPGAHWSALSPAAPLRRWRLIEVLGRPGSPLTTSRLQIDERVLHFLTGVAYLDDRLAVLLEPVGPGAPIVPSHGELARRIVSAWTSERGTLVVAQLTGGDDASRRAIAAAACAAIGVNLYALAADAIPAAAAELNGFLRLWEREAVLASSALYVDAECFNSAEIHAVAVVTRFLEQVGGAVVIGTPERWRALRRPTLVLDVRPPTSGERHAAWERLLGELPSNGGASRLASQFALSLPAMQTAVQDAVASGVQGGALNERLWDASRSQARPRLDGLAQRIEPAATWDDLVLPENELRQLREIAIHVAHRATVYEQWGYARASYRGLGISALFAGASGTGKTMAAEVLANALRLDLYRIDLSAVVSKYIGETEKNLRRVFDAAEDGGAILFFDEADALFGKRSEVKDSHDRYANIEINYLLQRMELYRGLAILATNLKSALDPAFLRRIRFVVNLPFPDAAVRAEIWRRAFPKDAPVEGLDIAKLSRLDLAGGSIRNVAMNSAFLAAGRGEPIRMPVIWQAARNEFAKLEKPWNEAVAGGAL